MLEPKEIKKYLDIINDLRRKIFIYDMHTHPFEVLSNDMDYIRCKNDLEIYSKKGKKFIPPKILKCIPECKNNNTLALDTELLRYISRMLMKKQYCHTGPGVFKAHMDLCGIDKSLLLPVAPSMDDMEDQMRCMARMFGSDNRFALGTSVPNTTSNDDIDSFLNQMITRYHIKAVKLHPNITEIDVGSNSGRTRVESILWACEKYDIPLIVHGGGSWQLKNQKASVCASINNLKCINWSRYCTKVVIAHAGFHSSSLHQIETDILPALVKMLKSNDNVFVDVSDLKVDELILVFRNIETSKIVFGSDALYNHQWSAIVKTMHALLEAECPIEESFCQIASINPSKHIFKGDVHQYEEEVF